MSDQPMTCASFEASLADYLEDELDGTTRDACEQHGASCEPCRALLNDLDTIVGAARTLPVPEPSHDLWAGIEARLETPVIALSSTRHRPVVLASAPMRWRQLAVAAVALITVSAGVTWSIARRGAETDVAGAAAATVVAESEPRATVPVALDPDSFTPAVEQTGDTPSNGRSSSAAARTTAATLVSSESPRIFAIDTLYGREIAMLRTVADQSLGLLDSSTVAVVERNLDIIDNAIRESRAALAADPNSGFLLEQLDRAYERKVDLLRRLALL